MKDALGDRMKSQYENRTRYFLPRRTYTIIRLDGKAFHTYTKACERPYDQDLIDAMDATAAFLCSEIQGARLAFVQSDEISILLTDFEKVNSNAWYDGNLQKIVSISASLATAYFNQKRMKQGISKLAFFDSRVFSIPDPIEVENYFIWRQEDCVRNSIAMLAQSLYTHKELMRKSSNDMQEMIFQKGMNWNDLNPRLKRGGLATRKTYYKGEALRHRWTTEGALWFSKERETFQELIPQYQVDLKIL
jgi:tRNA(His) guanylyltransferase